MRCRIRPSRPVDSKMLVEVWRSSVAATHSFVSQADLAAIDEEVQALLPGLPLHVALDPSGRPIGFIGFSEASIDSLFIDGNWQRLGIGRQLLEIAMEGRESLATIVNEDNRQAVGFYRYMGFEVTGRSANDEEGRPYPILHMKWIRGGRGHALP